MTDTTKTRTDHAPAAGPGYPAHWEADVVASDGGIVHLRPIVPSDADALLRFHASLSERTRYLRYFGPYPHVSARDLERFSVVNHRDRVAFICLLGGEVIAVGRYEGIPRPDGSVESAEVAFVARDSHQGRGLGSILLEHLAAAARENGLRRFEAEVLVENRAMVRVFRDAGYQVSRAFADGVLHLEFDIDPTERSLAVRDSREQRAEARSVHNALHPSSVAVIGASTDPSKIGHAILANLLRSNFTGPVFPVNAEARSVRGVRAYASVTDIPDEVDLAVVAVPASGIDDVLGSCFAKGVTTLVVVSAGFAETGPEGVLAERRLVTAARAHGMRVIGPNALGVANTAAEVRLNATLAPGPARTGPDRVLRAVGGAGHRDPRGGAQARSGAVDLRLGGQPRRPVGQRHAAVLADRPGHRSGAPVPGDVRQPAEVRACRAAARAHQADRRGEERAAHAVRSRGSPRTPSRSTTPACARCSSRPGSSGSTRSPSCSTPPCCCPTSRCPPGRGSRSWATPPRWACSSPTRWWGRGCSSRAIRSTSV